MKPEMLIIMPVFNEQESVRHVIAEWVDEVRKWTEDFRLLAINDGSRDQTESVLFQMRDELHPYLEVLSRENRGHGQSCLEGYRLAFERNIPFVFQIDSDGQCDPVYFKDFWVKRKDFDVIYGVRVKRDDGSLRVVASQCLKLFLLVNFGVLCRDANVPYRIMQTKNLGPFLDKIPARFDLVNVLMSVLLKKQSTLRHGYVPIRFRIRHGGVPSLKMNKFARKAWEFRREARGVL